jgi:hypothetical protein
VFVPRAVRTPAKRAAGHEWLNGPLVWAIDDWHQPLYLFPRDCPRILVWRTSSTTSTDAEPHFGSSSARMIAYIEERWADELATAVLQRYELPAASFTSLDDAGMWVSRTPVRPLARSELRHLPGVLRAAGVDLKVLSTLVPLKRVWDTTLHASGIRLRNAARWND